MKPSQFANKLRQIAAAINTSKSPKKNLVLDDLKRLAIMLEEVDTGSEKEETTETRERDPRHEDDSQLYKTMRRRFQKDEEGPDEDWDRERRRMNKEQEYDYPDDPGDLI